MNSVDLATMSLHELLASRTAIEKEIANRSYTRTSSSRAGELIERTAAVAYNGRLANVGAKSVDVISADGRGLQVKARSLPKGDLRH